VNRKCAESRGKESESAKGEAARREERRLTKACTGAAEESIIMMASRARRPGDAKR